MLSETWRAWKALNLAKIPLNLPHPLIKPLPVSERNLLLVRLDKKGSVAIVEDVAEAERIGMWRIVQTSDGSFPVIKVNLPFLNLPVDSALWGNLTKSKQDNEKLTLLDFTYNKYTGSARRTWADAGWKWRNSIEKASLIIKKLSDQDESGSWHPIGCWT